MLIITWIALEGFLLSLLLPPEPEDIPFGPVEMPHPEAPYYGDWEATPMPTGEMDWDNHDSFQECVDFARENGLTAVVVQPERNDTNIRLAVYYEPTVIYLDENGEEINPEGAPNIGLAGALNPPNLPSDDIDWEGERTPENEGGEYYTETGPDGEDRKFFTQDNGHTYYVWTNPETGEEQYINPKYQDDPEAVFNYIGGEGPFVPADFDAPRLEIPRLPDLANSGGNCFNGDRFDDHFAAGREMPPGDLCGTFEGAATDPNQPPPQVELERSTAPAPQQSADISLGNAPG